jgi:hypothetical protein
LNLSTVPSQAIVLPKRSTRYFEDVHMLLFMHIPRSTCASCQLCRANTTLLHFNHVNACTSLPPSTYTRQSRETIDRLLYLESPPKELEWRLRPILRAWPTTWLLAPRGCHRGRVFHCLFFFFFFESTAESRHREPG